MSKYIKIHLKIASSLKKIAFLSPISISFQRRGIEYLIRVIKCCWICLKYKIWMQKCIFGFWGSHFLINFYVFWHSRLSKLLKLQNLKLLKRFLFIQISKCPWMRRNILPFLAQRINSKCLSEQNYNLQ